MIKAGPVLYTIDPNIFVDEEEGFIDILFQEELDFVREQVTALMTKKNPAGYWKVSAHNLGWRHLDGTKYIEAYDFKSITDQTLPQTECSYNIANYGKGFLMTVYHHDAPTGERYHIIPCAESTYYKYK